MEIKGIDQVHTYLTNKGFTVSRATLFRHRKAGKLTANAHGTFSETVAMGYATLHLKPPKTTGSDSLADLENVQREKVLADARRSKALAKLTEEKVKAASGQYVLKVEAERQKAQLFGIMKSDIENFLIAMAPAQTDMVNGDQNKIPDLVDFNLEYLDRFYERWRINVTQN